MKKQKRILFDDKNNFSRTMRGLKKSIHEISLEENKAIQFINEGKIISLINE